MGRTYGRLNVKEAEQMLRAGKSQTYVAETFTARGEPITQAAISRAIANGRINLDTGRGRQRAGVPWRLKPEHRHLHAARMLRAAARVDQGLDIGPSLVPQLESWKNGLLEEDAVIHYIPDSEEGFWRVPRRHGIDKGWYRDPGYDDYGNRIAF